RLGRTGDLFTDADGHRRDCLGRLRRSGRRFANGDGRGGRGLGRTQQGAQRERLDMQSRTGDQLPDRVVSGGRLEAQQRAAGEAAATGPPEMAAVAFLSAACSNTSEGSLSRMPPPTGVPATGPAFCWTTWVSSCARVCIPVGVSGAYLPLWKTTSLPTVYAWA